MRQASAPFLLRAPVVGRRPAAAVGRMCPGACRRQVSAGSGDAPQRQHRAEKCTIRFDQADPALDEEIWSEIDEECLPPAAACPAGGNGFRAGVIGPHLPAALEVVIRENATSTPTTTASEQPPPATEELGVLDATPVDLMREPKIRRSLWQTRPRSPGLDRYGWRARCIPQVAVLMRDEEGRVAGRTYERVLGALSMKAMPSATAASTWR